MKTEMLDKYLTKLEEIVTAGVTYSVHVKHCFWHYDTKYYPPDLWFETADLARYRSRFTRHTCSHSVTIPASVLAPTSSRY